MACTYCYQARHLIIGYLNYDKTIIWRPCLGIFNRHVIHISAHLRTKGS